jgi:hypothetical protein
MSSDLCLTSRSSFMQMLFSCEKDHRDTAAVLPDYGAELTEREVLIGRSAWEQEQ